MIVSDNTIQFESLGDFLKHSGKKGVNVSKKMAKNEVKNTLRALEIGANIGTAFASRSPKEFLSTLPKVIKFYHGDKVFTLENSIDFILFKWNKKQIDYTHPYH